MADVQAMGTVGYTYDAYGRCASLGWPGGYYVYYGFDAADELVALGETNFGLIGIDYDDYGRRAHIYRNNGTGWTTTYNYDAGLRLGSITQGTSGASFYNVTSFGYSNADQIASKSGTNTAYNYSPQAKSAGYGIDGLNRIASVNGTSFAYDGRGNLSGDGSGSTYSYNVDNLLTSATQSGVTSNLYYDPENRLVQVDKPGFGATLFLYDGADLIAEYSYNGGTYTLLKRYVHGPGDDEPLLYYDYTSGQNGAKFYFGADDNGSVDLLTDATGGQWKTNTYDEYGLQGNSSGDLVRGVTVSIYRPDLAAGNRHVLLQGPALQSRHRPVHADRSHRVRGRHELVQLCAWRPGEQLRSNGLGNRQFFDDIL